MTGKAKTLKINIPQEQLAKIDAARVAAGYRTRTEYMIDSAVWGSPVYLREIAQHIGQLGLICNFVLLPDDDGSEHAHLQGEEARRAVRKIVRTCDAITKALRGDRCGPI
ncbi:MAG: hypothetical protein ACEPO2_00955 [Pelagibaca sp.]